MSEDKLQIIKQVSELLVDYPSIQKIIESTLERLFRINEKDKK